MGQRHHLVPQFYLKQFKVPGSSAGVYAYTRDGKVEQRNTRTIAYANDFYNFTDKNGNLNTDLEPAFSTIESDARPIIEKIIASEAVDLSETELQKFSYFITTLYTRNKAYRSKVTALYEAGMKTMMQIEAEDKEAFHENARQLYGDKTNEEQIERVRQRILKKDDFEIDHDPQTLLRQSLVSTNDLFPYFSKKHFYLLKAVGSRRFITSDNPVVVHHSSPDYSEIYGNGGIASSTISLPLSPEYCLCMDNREVTEKCKEVPDGLIDELLYLQCFYADYMVFSDTNSSEVSALFSSTRAGEGQAVATTYRGQEKTYNPKPDTTN